MVIKSPRSNKDMIFLSMCNIIAHKYGGMLDMDPYSDTTELYFTCPPSKIDSCINEINAMFIGNNLQMGSR